MDIETAREMIKKEDALTLEKQAKSKLTPRQLSLPQEAAVSVFMTSTENSGDNSWFHSPVPMKHQLAEKEKLYIGKKDDSILTTINIVPENRHQSLLGIGTSLEEATIYNLSKLTKEKRQEILRLLIDPNGIGMTLFRLCIGSPDFTGRQFYSYYDTPPTGEPDWYNASGKGFSIQKDIEYGIIDTVKDIIAIAKELNVMNNIKFFASIWSAPGWMKTDTVASGYYWVLGLNPDGLCAGAHNPEKRSDLAMYLFRFIEEYNKHGIDIHAITLQNEPWLETAYPSCAMSGNHQAELLIETKKLFKQKGLTTQIWVWDHNFDTVNDFLNEFTTISGGIEAMDGVAFHDYGGEPAAMLEIQNRFKKQNPNYSVTVTERSVWGTEGADRIIQYFRNGAISYNSWVTMLDSNISPHQWRNVLGILGTPDPTLLGRNADNDHEYWAMPELFITGNFSRFIAPGSQRIESNYGSKETVTNVAWISPSNDKITLIVTNQNEYAHTFKVVYKDKQFYATLPGKNVATYQWPLN